MSGRKRAAAGQGPGVTTKGDVLLQVRNLRTYFHTDDGVVKAVDGVAFEVLRGERLAIVGESGSGKSVTALSIMRLVPGPAGRIIEGSEILFKQRSLLSLSRKELQKVRGGEIGMVFQDPLSSLNPVYTVGSQIREAVRLHRDLSKREATKQAVELLARMGIPQPHIAVGKYPHEFSGGMRQRAMIAMAISCEPDLLIADEPTTALDVTIQAQIMELLMGLGQELNISVILITHDLGLVAGFAERILVMYAGRIVEEAETDELFYRPEHPYAGALLRSIARLDEQIEGRMFSIGGAPPNLVALPSGCSFHPRCSFNDHNLCELVVPELAIRSDAKHPSSCHYAGRIDVLSSFGLGANIAEPDAEGVRAP